LNVHDDLSNVLGRSTSDIASVLGTGIDGAVRRIGTTYNSQGTTEKLTSYVDTAGTSVANEVLRYYNGLMQVTTEFQSESGPVNTITSPKVQYSYSYMTSGANHSRLLATIYPNNRNVAMNYATGIDSNVSRVSNMTDGSGMLESYLYLGAGTIVSRNKSQIGVDTTYIKRTGESNGSGGDKYTGLDRFNRVVDQRTLTSSSGASLDRFSYGYDRNGNRLFKENLVSSANSELYTVDLADRLTSMQRGRIKSATHLA
jgi:hypothetical protein